LRIHGSQNGSATSKRMNARTTMPRMRNIFRLRFINPILFSRTREIPARQIDYS
jgi:hypothetical protein